MPEDRPSRSRPLLAAGRIAVGLLAAGTFLPRSPDPDLLFGIEGYRHLGIVAFFAATAIFLVFLLVPGPAVALSRAAGRMPTLPRWTGTALVAGAAGVVFWLLPNHFLSGDAASVVPRLALRDVHPSNALTNYVFGAVYGLLGGDPVLTVRLVSTLSGVVFAAAAVEIGRECLGPGPARIGLTVVLLTGGSTALFFGTIEVYAPFVAALTLYLLFGIRRLHGRGRGIAPPICLGIAFGLHGSAGLLLPSLLVLENRGRFDTVALRRWILSGLLFLLPVLLVFAALWFGTWGGQPPEAGPRLTGTFLGVGHEKPWLPLVLSPHRPTKRYAVLDGEHLVGVANLVLLVAAAGVLLLLSGRRPRKDPVFRFVGAAALFLLLFPVFWNISYDIHSDWDLFSSMGVPIALLGGLAFFSTRRTGADALRAGLLSLLFLVPVVLVNHSLPEYREAYAETLSGSLADAIPLSAARDAVEELPEASGSRRAREELQREGAHALRRARSFRAAGVEAVLDELAGELGKRLPAPAARVLFAEVEGVVRDARDAGRPVPPTEIAGLDAVLRATERPEIGSARPGGPGPRDLELSLLDALDAALATAGAEALAARPDPAAIRAEAPGELGAALARVLEDGPDGRRWPALLAAQRKWAARARAFRPAGAEIAYRRVSWLWSARGDLPRAERYARHWSAKMPDDPDWLDLLGGILLARGERREGMERLRRAIRLDPHAILPRIRLTNELVSTGGEDEALELLSRGVRISAFYPMATSALFQIAWLRLQRGEPEIAASVLRLVLERIDDTPGTPENRALRRRAEELLERASILLRHAIPAKTDIYDN